MGKFINIESPLFLWLSKFADVMVLNILFVVSSIPVITIGAATAALYDVTMRIARDEGQVWRNYWKAFRLNLKQATLLWLILLVSGLIVGFSVLFYLQSGVVEKGVSVIIAVVMLFLWAITFAWVFPMQARFENTVLRTLKNALFCGLACLFRSIVVVFVNLVPVICLLVLPTVFVYLAFAWLLFWFSAAASINMRVLKKQFTELEKLSVGQI